MDVTAKVRVIMKVSGPDQQTNLTFGADYYDERNKEWSRYTPSLSLSMTVLDSVAEQFKVGQAFILTFTPEAFLEVP